VKFKPSIDGTRYSDSRWGPAAVMTRYGGRYVGEEKEMA
jgi:hypothetical protein